MVNSHALDQSLSFTLASCGGEVPTAYSAVSSDDSVVSLLQADFWNFHGLDGLDGRSWGLGSSRDLSFPKMGLGLTFLAQQDVFVGFGCFSP